MSSLSPHKTPYNIANRPAGKIAGLVKLSSGEQEEGWMISYIDVFVLMSTVFVMLLVLNQPEPKPTEKNAPGQTSSIPTPAVLPQNNWQQLEQALEALQLEDHVTLKLESNFAELEIGTKVLFPSGETTLSRAGQSILKKLMPLLKKTSGLIFIEGHTDNQPIKTRRFPSNWDLASARANEVLRYLTLNNMAPSRLRAVSFGDTQPIAPNDSEANRSKNRRVSLMIQALPNLEPARE